MEKISNIRFITDGKWDWEHSLGHAERVSHYIKKLLVSIHCSPHIIELGMIAGLLHDIGLTSGQKSGHAEKSAILANEFLKNYPIGINDREIIVQAIKDHSNGNNIQTVIGAALLLADKLDISYYRVINSTIQDNINEEFLKVKRVDIEINSQDIWIYYKTEKTFDISILKAWPKALSIPIKVAKYLNRNCNFKLKHENLPIKSLLTN